MQSVIGALRVILGADTAALEEGLTRAQRHANAFGRQMERIGARMQRVGSSISMRLSAPVAGLGALTLKAAADFEAAMNRVQAVLQPTADEFAALRDLAAELGRTTQFTAAQAADGLEMLARNGLNATQILDGAAEATLKLAAAAGSELAPAADVVTDLMLNFSREGADLGRVVDNIAGTLSKSKLGWEDYAQAIGQAAGAAGPLGMSLEDMNAALAATAPSFASGAEAGTSFKGFLLRLVPQTDEARAIMGRLNLQFFDAQGNLKSLTAIAENLRTSFAALTAEERTEALGKLFGQRTIRTALRLMEEGAAGIERLKQEIADVSAADMAAARLRGFTGELTQLKSAAEGLAIAIADSGLLRWATDLIKSLTEMVRGLAETNPELLKWATLIGLAAAALGPLILGLGSFAAGIGLLVPVLVTLGTTLAGMIAASGPIGMFILAAGLITAAWAQWGDEIIALVQRVYEGIKTWLQDKLQAVFDWLGEQIDAVAGFFSGLYDKVVGNSYVPDMVLGIEAWMQRLGQTMPAAAGRATDGVASIFERSSVRLNALGNTIASNMARAFSSWTETGKFSVRDMVRSILSDLARLAANNVFRSLLAPFFGAGAAGIGIPGSLGWQTSVLPAFAQGGSFRVGGSGGTDSQLVAFRATPGEMVDIRRPGERDPNAPVNITFNVTTPDAASFKRSESQVAAMLNRAVSRGTRNL